MAVPFYKGEIMTEGEERREHIIQLLTQTKKPISGTELAKQMKVSRQVIVQDIALLRASNRNILSTNKGYLYDRADEKKVVRRTFFVCHTDEQMAEELFAIVDNGGRLRDVVVEHEIYGQITVDLILENRCDVQDFLDKISKSTVRPLSILTNGKHYHTVEADREEIIDRIEQKLRLLGYLQETI